MNNLSGTIRPWTKEIFVGGNQDPEGTEAPDPDRDLHGLRQPRSDHDCPSNGGAGIRAGGRR